MAIRSTISGTSMFFWALDEQSQCRNAAERGKFRRASIHISGSILSDAPVRRAGRFFSTSQMLVWTMCALAARWGVRVAALEESMNAGMTYRFDLLNDSGTRNCLFIAQCFGDEHAVLLARALFESAFVRMKCIRVWRDDVLVHEANKSKRAKVN
jgi:hypothetical protein